MNPLATSHQPLSTRHSSTTAPSLRFGCHGNPSPAIRPPVQVSNLRLIRPAPSLRFQVSGLRHPRKRSFLPAESASLATRHSSLVTGRRPAAFTLIELLVVIAIIAILAGLGFAGMQGAMESSKKAQARNDVHQIASAVKAYLLEYGKLPSASPLAELTGDNPKKVVFLEAKNAKGDPPKGGLSQDRTKMYDPWGKEYVIELDTDYDNKVRNQLTTVIVETTPPGNNQKPINNVQ